MRRVICLTLIAFVLGVVGGTVASYATDDFDPQAPLVMNGEPRV